MRVAIAIVIAALPALARAQPQPEPQEQPQPQPQSDRIDDVEQHMDELEQKLHKLERVQASEHSELEKLRALARFITVYVDVGAFAVAGNGSGIRNDLDHVYFPKYTDRIAGQWVFMGDPLSTAINSLGEPADTANSREIRNDTVHSGGHPSLIVNSVGLSIGKEVYRGISVAALAELLPRPGPDLLDVELANVQYRPFDDLEFAIVAGKVESVLGVEYRFQDANRRLGVTPSLICRYTCGRPVGIRGHLRVGKLSAAAALLNGDSFDERFEPATMLKANSLPTAAGHLQWMLPVGQGLEIGVSGAIGPQTGQPELGIAQWHFGIDARLVDYEGWEVTAEYVQGLQQGKTTTMAPCNAAPCLSYKGAYLLVDRHVNPRLTPYVRVDWRDAVHQNGVDFVYESHVMRATVGANFAVTSRILGKFEYTFNHELGGIPQFADDIITSSVVVATD